MTLPKFIKIIIVVAMFSDIREDGRSYESSNHSDSNDENTTGHENHFLPRPSSSEFTDFDNIHMSNTTGYATGESSDVAERVRKVLEFMSTVNFDLTGFLDVLPERALNNSVMVERVCQC